MLRKASWGTIKGAAHSTSLQHNWVDDYPTGCDRLVQLPVWPRLSMPHSLAVIPAKIYIYILYLCVCTMIMIYTRYTHIQTHTRSHTHTHSHTHIYIYIILWLCMFLPHQVLQGSYSAFWEDTWLFMGIKGIYTFIYPHIHISIIQVSIHWFSSLFFALFFVVSRLSESLRPILGFLLIGMVLGPAGIDVIRHVEPRRETRAGNGMNGMNGISNYNNNDNNNNGIVFPTLISNPIDHIPINIPLDPIK